MNSASTFFQHSPPLCFLYFSVSYHFSLIFLSTSSLKFFLISLFLFQLFLLLFPPTLFYFFSSFLLFIFFMSLCYSTYICHNTYLLFSYYTCIFLNISFRRFHNKCNLSFLLCMQFTLRDCSQTHCFFLKKKKKFYYTTPRTVHMNVTVGLVENCQCVCLNTPLYFPSVYCGGGGEGVSPVSSYLSRN